MSIQSEHSPALYFKNQIIKNIRRSEVAGTNKLETLTMMHPQKNFDGGWCCSSLSMMRQAILVSVCFLVIKQISAFSVPGSYSQVRQWIRTNSQQKEETGLSTSTTLFMSATLHRPSGTGFTATSTNVGHTMQSPPTPNTAGETRTTTSTTTPNARVSRDYCCNILGVPRHATDGQIKKAYRHLAKMYHPGK